MPHAAKLSTLKAKWLYSNCLGSGHYWRQCTSIHKCKVCQKPHHTLLHFDQANISSTPATINIPAPSTPNAPPQAEVSINSAARNVSGNSNTLRDIFAATAVGVTRHSLLMTCRVCVKSPSGACTIARALLDSVSSASFIYEHLAQSLRLPRTKRDVIISGVAGFAHKSLTQSFATFNVSPVNLSTKVISVTAAIVPQVTCEFPMRPVTFSSEWSHLNGLQLADPSFGNPGHIDLLLGVDVFVNIFRRFGRPGTLTAFETHFGWVLAGSVEGSAAATPYVLSRATQILHHAMTSSADSGK